MRRDRLRAQEGFTLVELVLGISVLLVCTLALGFALQAGAGAARELREEQVILAQALTFVDRIVAQEFGHDYDPDPTVEQIDEVFDGDADPGNITITQLGRYPVGDGGWKFRLGGFAVDGEWRVVVDRDLDGDGSVAGDIETGGRLFRVWVFFDERLVLRTNRCKEVTL